MYYFGVNLDTRFSVPDFWPAPETTHRIPFEREELKELAARLKAERLEKKRRRLERGGGGEGVVEGEGGRGAESVGTFGVGSIERWARGRWRD